MSKIRLGMVGGGCSSWIGHVHRMASGLDGRYRLVAGALSSHPDRARQYARELEIGRAYDDYRVMAREEGARADGIEAVSVVTPNPLHCPVAQAFVEQGIHVICDKPLAYEAEETEGLCRALRQHPQTHFVLTHNYSGYPLARQLREMVAAGELGEIWWVDGCYLQDWVLLERGETERTKTSAKQHDPAEGVGGIVPGIGSHLAHLFEFVLRDRVATVSGELQSFARAGGKADSAQLRVRTHGGVRGQLWMSQVASGHKCHLALHVYGSKGSARWAQDDPNRLFVYRAGEAERIITPNGSGASAANRYYTRLPEGHPEGFLGAFAQMYRDAADLIQGRENPYIDMLPGIEDGLSGIALFHAVRASHRQRGAWVKLPALAQV